MYKHISINMSMCVLVFFTSFISTAPAKQTKKEKNQQKSAINQKKAQEEKALAKRQEKPLEFWDKVVICFAKNYREQHPEHFIPQMSDRQCTIFALQNAIPSVMNLDLNLMEFVIQKVASLHDKNLIIDLEGWSSSEIMQALTQALNRQVSAENKANGYDSESEKKESKE